jgi:hypothetical protein
MRTPDSLQRGKYRAGGHLPTHLGKLCPAPSPTGVAPPAAARHRCTDPLIRDAMMRCGWLGGLVAPAQGCVKILGKERAGLVSDETEADRQRLRVSVEHMSYQRTITMPGSLQGQYKAGGRRPRAKPGCPPLYPWGATSCYLLTAHRWN